MSHNILKILIILAASIAIVIPSINFAQRIEVYFSKDVNTALCDSLGIEYLPDGWNVRLDSLLAVYIDSAEYSVDMCVYRWSDTTARFLMPALRRAFEREIKIRVVTDDWTTEYSAMADSLDLLEILYIDDNRSAYMHNKFFIIDGRDDDSTNDILIVSSCNLSDDMTRDADNIVVIHWAPLASNFTIQFNIYWGDSGDIPNPDSAIFNSNFPDIITHQLFGEDIWFEVFFSPQKPYYEDSILARIESAIYQAFFCINIYNRGGHDLDSIMRVIFEERGISLRGVFGDVGTSVYSVYRDMTGTSEPEYNWDEYPPVFINEFSGGDIHHKFLIADVSYSDYSFVLTGSMNWSDAGFHSNNECVLIIHSYEVAQKFFAEFATRYVEAGGSFVGITEKPISRTETMRIYPNPARNWLNVFPTGNVEIYDIRGQWVGDFCPPIMLCNLPAGEYIVRQGRESRKIIVLP